MKDARTLAIQAIIQAYKTNMFGRVPAQVALRDFLIDIRVVCDTMQLDFEHASKESHKGYCVQKDATNA